jgi:hypothetical protein
VGRRRFPVATARCSGVACTDHRRQSVPGFSQYSHCKRSICVLNYFVVHRLPAPSPPCFRVSLRLQLHTSERAERRKTKSDVVMSAVVRASCPSAVPSKSRDWPSSWTRSRRSRSCGFNHKDTENLREKGRRRFERKKKALLAHQLDLSKRRTPQNCGVSYFFLTSSLFLFVLLQAAGRVLRSGTRRTSVRAVNRQPPGIAH